MLKKVAIFAYLRELLLMGQFKVIHKTKKLGFYKIVFTKITKVIFSIN